MVDTNVAVPQYCGVCGSRLVPSENVQGYDPYTGTPIAEQSLHCSNPSTRVTGRFIVKTDIVYHPSWTNEAGHWVLG